MNKVTGLPRALPWCGTVGEARGCWLGTSEVAAVCPGASRGRTAHSHLPWPCEYPLSVPRRFPTASMHSSAAQQSPPGQWLAALVTGRVLEDA